MGSFSIPLSGLNAAQDQLQSVSNNLANINTVGYKDQRVQFSDIFFAASATNGSGDPIQTGEGVNIAATTNNFTEGTLSQTSVASNMALQGKGFFVTQQSNGQTDYTRAGDFTTNSTGQLITPNGELVLGYPAVAGVVSNSAVLQPLQIGANSISPASATSTFNITANLQSSAAVGATSASTFTGYDSLGTPHTFTVQYTKTAANSWNYAISLPAADTGGPGATTTIANGTLTFNSSGQLTAPTGTVPGITVPVLADGAAPLNMTWDLNDNAGNPTLTQTDSPSATSETLQNGYASGSLLSYAVTADGTIEGTFSSGKSLALGRVAVATFTNVQGLSRVGNNNYVETAASGLPVVGVAGTGGRATILGGTIEQSNVDIAAEFANLIVAQQAYSANAKAVTTFDQVSQTTIAMKI